MQDAVQALIDSNRSLAEDVKDKDAMVKELEGIIDQECNRILAKHRPDASDLCIVLLISKW